MTNQLSLRNVTKEILPPIVVSLIRKIKNTPSKAQLEPQWHRVENGPLKGYFLYLNTYYGAWPRRMLKGEWEVEIVATLESIVQPGWICVDAGGHIGYFTLLLAKLTGKKGQVHTFEPLPYNVERIQRNVERNKKTALVNIHSLALSDASGLAVLHGSSRLPESCGAYLESVRTPPSGQSVYKRFIEFTVEQKRLDDLVEQKVVPRPNLIKIDVEGAEVAVLRGALATLRKVKPVLVVELHNTANAVECMEILLNIGYRTQILEYNGETCSIIAS